MRRFSIPAAIAVVLAVAQTPALAQSQTNLCDSQRLKYCDGCVLDLQIDVPAGKSCVIQSDPGSGWILGIEFTVRPKAGRVGKANAFTFAYQAPNREGEDYFENVVRWKTANTAQSVRVRTHVRIGPAVP